MKKIALLVLVLGSLLVVGTAAFGANEFHLKPGARGKVCLECHYDFAAKLKLPFVHTPVKQRDCVGCHSPHTSDHGKLLLAKPDKLCVKCHSGILPKKAASVHQVVAEGKCTACHDPHASKYKDQLVRGGEKLCFGCHKDIAKQVKGLKYPHPPVSDDCLDCHNPHASGKGKFLLASNPPELCKQCHDTSKRQFSAMHLNYPVAKADCTSCHNPHGSNRKHMLYDHVHEPVAKRLCNQCHEGPGSKNPLKLKKQGYQLCQTCHTEMVKKVFAKNRLHWPLATRKGCLQCHSPHASSGDYLLQGSQLQVCGRCHADTLRRQKQSKSKHEPVKDGACSVCHDPHSSNNEFLARKASVIKLCGTCHDWQQHSSHPIGPKFKDLRNPNLTMNCLSCHRSHGTPYRKLIPFATDTDLCVQCHTQYRR